MSVSTPGVTSQAAAKAFYKLAAAFLIRGAAVGRPKEKIRIEPLETPVPSKEPAAPAETPEVEVPEKVPA